VIRFEFADQPQRGRAIWLVVRSADAEVCTKSPGYDDDLVVQTTTMTLAKWHTRQLEWADAQRSGQIRVTGPRALARMLPTWNLRASTPWNDQPCGERTERQQRASHRERATTLPSSVLICPLGITSQGAPWPIGSAGSRLRATSPNARGSQGG
jgi:hypothetical protein